MINKNKEILLSQKVEMKMAKLERDLQEGWKNNSDSINGYIRGRLDSLKSVIIEIKQLEAMVNRFD